MSAQVEGTSNNGENKFVEWLRGHGVKADMIQKLTQEIGSVDELTHIKEDEIDGIAKEMQLKLLQKSKLRYIVEKAKSAKNDNTWNVISSEEQEILIKMTNKIEEIQKSVENIGKIQKGIDDEVTHWTKQIESAFFDVNTALNKRKIELIKKLNKIANEHKSKLNNKNKQLNQQHSQSKKHLKDVQDMLRKPLDIQQIKSRQNTVLNLSKDINNTIIPNIINNEYKINVSINKNDLIKIINNFADVSSMPTPVLLSIDGKNPVKLKWKLKNYNGQKGNQKIKIEWTKLELNENKDNDMDEKEMKLEFNNNKTFDVNNYNNNKNEISLNIGYQKGIYYFKLYYFDSHSWSVESNIKSIKITKKQMQFYTDKSGDDLQFINGNIVKKINNNGSWRTCLFGKEINDTMCNQFNIYVTLKTFTANKGHQVFVGYIKSNTPDVVKNWNNYLNIGNPQDSVAYYIHHSYNYFMKYTEGSSKNLDYKAQSKFKQDDTFKFAFSFANNELTIHHNGTKAETLSLDNCKTFIFAICVCAKDTEVEITNYEFL